MGCAILGALVLAGCGWDQVNPEATKSTPDYPCGVIGVICLDMQGKESGYCCIEGETCGGGLYSVGCPPEECCDIRQIPVMASRNCDDAGLCVSREPPAQSTYVTPVGKQRKAR